MSGASDGPFDVFGDLEVEPGVRLRWARAAAPEARATALVLHGRTEFIEKYQELAVDLRARGFEVLTFDWRGQGRSTRPLAGPDTRREAGHIDRFETYLHDLHRVVLELAAGADRPLVLVGHSMGGHIGLRYLHDHPERVRFAAFSAPMVQIRALPALRGPLRLAVRAGAALGHGQRYFIGGDWGERQRRFEGNALTSDPDRFQRAVSILDREPALRVGGPTFGWLAAADRSMTLLSDPAYARRIRTPVLLGVPGADTVVEPQATVDLASAMPAAHLLIVPESRHELLQEREPLRARFFQAFDALASDLL